MDENIPMIKYFYELKKVLRTTLIDDRFESSAEHTWSSLVLAEFFLKKYPELDEIKVLRMLLYHDVVEIEAGDINFFDTEARKNKEKDEQKAMRLIKTRIPKELRNDFESSFTEFENKESREAKFCKAIDKLDPIINELDDPENWKKYGLSKENMLKKHKGYFEEFPLIEKFFHELLDVAEKNNYYG